MKRTLILMAAALMIGGAAAQPAGAFEHAHAIMRAVPAAEVACPQWVVDLEHATPGVIGLCFDPVIMTQAEVMHALDQAHAGIPGVQARGEWHQEKPGAVAVRGWDCTCGYYEVNVFNAGWMVIVIPGDRPADPRRVA